jgi:MFS family permease
LFKALDQLISAEGRTEWRAHWLVVTACIVGIMISQLHLYSLGVMTAPLEHEFGWRRTQVTSGLMIISMIVFPLAPVVGMAIDRIGPRKIALCGITLYALAVALLSFAGQALWTWWLLWLLVGFGHLLIKPTVWVAAITGLFAKSRGLALAIALSASGLAASLGPILTVLLLENYGWRTAYLALGGLAAASGIPVIALFFWSARDKQSVDVPARLESTIFLEGRSAGPSLRNDVMSLAFVKLVATALIMSIVSMGMIVSLVPILTSSGFAPVNAAAIAGMVGVSQIIGRLSAGLLLDRIDARLIGAVTLSCPAVTCLILIFAGGSAPFAALAVIVFGLTIGAEVEVIAYLAGRIFDPKNFGTLFGIVVGVLSLGNGLGPMLGGLSYDLAGSYAAALWGAVPLALMSSYLILSLGRFPAPAQH